MPKMAKEYRAACETLLEAYQEWTALEECPLCAADEAVNPETNCVGCPWDKEIPVWAGYAQPCLMWFEQRHVDHMRFRSSPIYRDKVSGVLAERIEMLERWIREDDAAREEA